MQDSEKHEIAEQNATLMDKIYKSIQYFMGVSILFLIIDYFTSGGGWSFWVIGIWGLVLLFEWLKVKNTIRKNCLGSEETRK